MLRSKFLKPNADFKTAGRYLQAFERSYIIIEINGFPIMYSIFVARCCAK